MRRPEIMVAPNGARRPPAEVPTTLAELPATAAACQAAGADALHLHIRDTDGRHSLDPGRYAETMAAVAEAAPGLSIQITTESAGRFSPADQLACLDALRPGRASAAIREIGRDQAVAARFYALAAEAGIRLQHILYDTADIERLRAARAAGLLPQTKAEAIFVLGAYDPPRTGRPGDLTPLLAAAADLDLDWAVCAFGPAEHACVTEAMRRGGDARVGFENNTLCPDGRPAEDNAALVALAAQAREAITLQEAHR